MNDTEYAGPKYLTTRELATRLRCSPGHLSNERSRGRGIPYYKFGGSCLYAESDVRLWETAQRVEPATA